MYIYTRIFSTCINVSIDRYIYTHISYTSVNVSVERYGYKTVTTHTDNFQNSITHLMTSDFRLDASLK